MSVVHQRARGRVVPLCQSDQLVAPLGMMRNWDEVTCIQCRLITVTRVMKTVAQYWEDLRDQVIKVAKSNAKIVKQFIEKGPFVAESEFPDCVSCEKPIKPGMYVRFDENGYVVHINCDDPEALPPGVTPVNLND